MKRYWLFAFHCYHADGGFNDFKGAYDDLAIAESVGQQFIESGTQQADEPAYHVVDSTIGEIVA